MKKNTLFLTMGIVGCLAGLAGIVFLTYGYVKIYIASIAITGIAACLFIMLDPTDKKSKASKSFISMGILILIVMTMVALSSCSRSGYGCKGKDSWNKTVRRINNGY